MKIDTALHLNTRRSTRGLALDRPVPRDYFEIVKMSKELFTGEEDFIDFMYMLQRDFQKRLYALGVYSGSEISIYASETDDFVLQCTMSQSVKHYLTSKGYRVLLRMPQGRVQPNPIFYQDTAPKMTTVTKARNKLLLLI